MVGTETLLIYVHGLPATRSLASIPALSGLTAGLASGGIPGQMGTCVCPEDGCQTCVWALRAKGADSRQRTQRASFTEFIAVSETIPTLLQRGSGDAGTLRLCETKRWWNI